MCRLRAALTALRVASWRDRRSLQSFATNNLFLTCFAFGAAMAFFFVVMALVLIFPLTSDPLRKFPPERLRMLPLTSLERSVLHLLSPWVNPVTWVIVAFAIWAAIDRAPLIALAVLLFPIAGLLFSWLPVGPRRNLWRRLPAFPGPFGQLVRKDIREILCTLDFWFAVLLSLSCLSYRLFVHKLPQDALMVFSILAVLALSTWSQSSFGLDGDDGILRYRLLPVSGWRVLGAKGVAFMLVVTLVALPLSLPTAWAAGLVAFAIGNKHSVVNLRAQRRWRFSSGSNALTSLVQILLTAAAGAATYRVSAWLLVPCLLFFLLATFQFGRRLFA